MNDQTLAEHVKQDVIETVERLKTERDEIRVKAHLLKAELRDEWDEVESKWRYLEERMERRSKTALHAVEDVNDAVKKACEDIADAYRRMRKH